MIVMKFGGSSVRDAERILHVIKLVKNYSDKNPVLVFSALGKTTDLLLRAGEDALNGSVSVTSVREHHYNTALELGIDKEPLDPLFEELEDLLKGVSLLKELSSKTKDYLVSFGERLAARIISSAFNKQGLHTQWYDAWDIGFTTNSHFGDAEILPETYQNVKEILSAARTKSPHIPVVTGFIAKDPTGRITTLGRGGSDLTASILGSALGAEEIQVWKDVDGILTTDPRIVASAKPVPFVTFEEAAELAYFGAKVLHPLSIQPAMRCGIPVRVKNSYNPEHPGTLIVGSGLDSDGLVKAITCKRNVTLIDIVSSRMLGQYGFLASVFQIFNDFEVSVDMVATSEVSVSLTINNGAELQSVCAALEKIAKVTIGKNKAILSLIGNVGRASEILDSAFAILRSRSVNVQMISQGASKVNIGLIVEDSEVEDCIQNLHSHFFETHKVAV